MINVGWYVPSIDENNFLGLPADLEPTIYDPANYTLTMQDNLSTRGSIDIKKRLELFRDVLGQDFNPFTPERLALHETAIALATTVKFDGEEAYQASVRNLYRNEILPVVQKEASYFDSLRADIRESLRQRPFKGPEYADKYAQTGETFDKSLEKYREQADILNTKIAEWDTGVSNEASVAKERVRLSQLERLIHIMETDREGIILEIATERLFQEKTRAYMSEMIAGALGTQENPGRLALSEHLDFLTLHPADMRKSILITGAPASRKSLLREHIMEQEMSGSHDAVMMNPDFYKGFLMEPEHQTSELFGSLTHAESSLIFDGIAERWQEKARSGSAPDLVMDILRSSRWMRDVASTGDTRVIIANATLPVETTLQSSYERGQETGRFMPSHGLILGHTHQPWLLLDSINSGYEVQVFSTDVERGAEPVPAFTFDPATPDRITVYRPDILIDYCEKATLDPTAHNAAALKRNSTPEQVAGNLLSHVSESRSMLFQNEEGEALAALSKNETGKVTFHVEAGQWPALEKALGGGTKAEFLLRGLLAHQVTVENETIASTVERITVELQEQAKDKRPAPALIEHIDAEKYVELLRQLVEKGSRWVKDVDNVVYNFGDHADENFPRGVQIRQESPDQPGIVKSVYDLSTMGENIALVFEARYYPTKASREEAIATLKETGILQGVGISLNQHMMKDIGQDYAVTAEEPPFITVTPKPESAKVALQLMDSDDFRLPNNRGGFRSVPPYGFIACGERDLEAIKEALHTFDESGKDDYSLFLRSETLVTMENGEGVKTSQLQSQLNSEAYVAGSEQQVAVANFPVYGTQVDYFNNAYTLVPVTQQEMQGIFSRLLSEPARLVSVQGDEILALRLDSPLLLPDGTTLQSDDFLTIPKEESQRLAFLLERGELVKPDGTLAIKAGVVPAVLATRNYHKQHDRPEPIVVEPELQPTIENLRKRAL